MTRKAVLVTLLALVLGVIVGLAVCSLASAATLTWQDNATNEEGTAIERAGTACAPTPPTPGFAQVGTVAANVKTYVDTPAAGSQYCYRVRAFNHQYANGGGALQYSAYSNEAGFDFPFPPPGAAPSQLNATP